MSKPTSHPRAVLVSLLAAFVLTMAAGVVVGMAAGRRGASETTETSTTSPQSQPSQHGNRPRHWLDRRLDLTRDQSEKIEAIWKKKLEDPSFRSIEDQRKKLFHDRELEFDKLLTDSQKSEYQRILSDYSSRLGELGKARDAAMQEAVRQTQQVLNDAQKQEYDRMLLAQHGRHGPGERDHSRSGTWHGPPGQGRGMDGRGGMHGFMHGESRPTPTTEPTAMPAAALPKANG